jgi:hypothetical protein
MGCCPICETDTWKCTCGEMFANKQKIITNAVSKEEESTNEEVINVRPKEKDFNFFQKR